MKEKLQSLFNAPWQEFIVISSMAVGGSVLLRIYEFLALGHRYELPSEMPTLILQSFYYDLRFTFALFSLAALVYLALAKLSAKAATYGYALLSGTLLFIQFGLERYFSQTRTPAGAEVLAYSQSDLSHAVLSSAGGIGPAELWLAVTVLILFGIYGHGLVKGKMRSLDLLEVRAFFAATFIAPLLLFFFPANARNFTSENHYFLAVNKPEFFIAQNFLFKSGSTASSTASRDDYPWLKEAKYDDVLGPYFNLGPEKPNIVLILVEGLGSDIMRKGKLAGFTPFLDELAAQGLYWENFLSTSGRTFGILPSVLGSLPHAQQGFTSLAEKMPAHLGLPSLLRDNGYRTRFFHGSNADFDGMRVFLKRQKIDLLVDQFHFSEGAERAGSDQGGFSWGYTDGALMQQGLEAVRSEAKTPFLDIFLTITTHEPFNPPRKDHYLALFEQRAAALPHPEDVRREVLKNADVFATFLYTDEVLRNFFEEYKKLPEYANTIFVVTGDHRMIPTTERNSIARYHVPLIIASALLKGPRAFPAVSSHLDITPSLLALLRKPYRMNLPPKEHWMGEGLDTNPQFRAQRSLAFMRTKVKLSDYLSKDLFLSTNGLFKLGEGLELERVQDPATLTKIEAEFKQYEDIAHYVATKNRLYPGTISRELSSVEMSYASARKLAFQKKYAEARSICEELLKVNPNDHDVRALMGRTHAWEKNYEKAREIFNELIDRAPNYADGYAALAYMEYWMSNDGEAERLIDKSLVLAPKGAEYLMLKARLLRKTKRLPEAREMVDRILADRPTNQEAIEFKRSLEPQEGGP